MATASVAAAKAPTSIKSMSTLEAEVAGHSKTLKDRLAQSAAQSQKVSELSSEMESAIKSGDINKLKIINATFASSSADYQDLSKGLAEAMTEFGKDFQDVSQSMKTFQAFTQQEQGVIDTAAGKVETAKSAVTNAERALTGAYNQPTFLGMQKRAVDNAQSVLDTANANLATYETALENAKQAAETLRRTRLQGMSLEQSLQNMQNGMEEIVQISTDRIAEIDENLKATEVGGRAAQVKLEELSRTRSEAEEGVKRLSAEISSMNEEQQLLTANTPEWVKLGNQIAEKQRARDELEGTHNNTVAVYQETQRFIEMYRVQEKTQRSLRKFHQVWIEMLTTGVKERTVLYLSYLGVVKAADDQRAMQAADAIALRVDEDISMNTAQHEASIRSNILDRLEQAPENIRRIRDVGEAMDENAQQFEERFNVLVKSLADDWGGSTATNKQPEASAAA